MNYALPVVALLIAWVGYLYYRRQVERRQALRAMAQSRELLLAIIAAVPVRVFWKDCDLRYLGYNTLYAKDCAMEQAQTLVGKSDTELGWATHAEADRALDQAVLDSGIPRLFYDAFQTTASGQMVCQRTSKVALQNSRGETIGLLGIYEDVTASKIAEERLRQLSVAVEQSPASVVITDLSARIVYVNARFTEVTGYSASEAIGQNPRILHSKLTPHITFTKLWQALGSGQVWRGEFVNQRKNGDIYWEEAQIVPVKNAAGSVTHYVAVKTDITERKQQEDRARQSALSDAQAQDSLNAAARKHLAYQDALTSLPNRRLLQERLLQALQASQHGGHWGAILFVDLDDFKTVNEALGHDKGDSLLQQVAHSLPACVRDGDTVARLGSDEFSVLLEDLGHDLQDAIAQSGGVGEKILRALNQTYQLGNCRHHSTVSIGIALFAGAHQDGIEGPMQQAELAMYHAKAAGPNSLRYFDPVMQSQASARAALEMSLREALDKGQFQLWYQPQIRGADQLTGVEALVRWNDPVRGRMSPAAFIPLAEETGLILPLGAWVIEAACQQLTRWADCPAFAALSVAVNVSARQFHQHDFVEQVLAILARTGARPQRLKIELTESLLVSNVEEVIAKMNVLKGIGIDFSLDDFGTGYSSLSYLKRLPLSQLKIDQSFVRDIVVNSNDAAIARMVIALADSLGLAVIAEGVETEDQRDFLAQLGCHAFQGYLFSRPLAPAAFEAFVLAPDTAALHSIRHNGTVELL